MAGVRWRGSIVDVAWLGSVVGTEREDVGCFALCARHEWDAGCKEARMQFSSGVCNWVYRIQQIGVKAVSRCS